VNEQFAEYAAHGWKLCAISPGNKGPTYGGWNTRPITDPDVAAQLDGVGLLHSLSGTCAIDVDNEDRAIIWLAERAINLSALLTAVDSVQIHSGRPGRCKLLYRLTKPLRTLKPKDSGIELRCGTADGKSVQDVLPGTVHPDTKRPYVWRYGDVLLGTWKMLPPIPAVLAAAWRTEIGADSHTQAHRALAASNDGLEEFRALAAQYDVDDYNQWIKVAMAIHHETQGSEAGLALWDEWSRTGRKYKGVEDLRLHWRSFSSGAGTGKRVTTVASLRAESVASADEFAIVESSAEQPATQPGDGAAAKAAKAAAIETLEARLVYVRKIERYFDTDTHSVIQTESGLQNLFMAEMPRRRGVKIDPVRLLKESRSKKIVDAVGFHPGEAPLFDHDGNRYANLYRDRAVTPLMPTAHELEVYQWLMNRITDATFKKYWIAFCAHVVQRPGMKIRSAPLLWSDTTGNGKTTILATIPKLLVGAEYSQEVTAQLLESDFNDYLLNTWHVNLAEFKATTKKERTSIINKLKPWITDPTISVHPKGARAFTIPNQLIVTATSNDDDAAAIDNEDRRWAICELEASKLTDEEKRMLSSVFETARSAGVMHWIYRNESIVGFSPNANAPETGARAAMIEASLSELDEALRGAFERQEGPFTRDAVEMDEIIRFCKSTLGYFTNVHRLGRKIRKPPYNGEQVQCRLPDGRSYRIWIFRNKADRIEMSRADLIKYALGDEIA
jgi:Bifunctional DNA primase/polymerase, N-terminal/Primase C terminal 2 (PriCT-2)/Virulence-associated protein E